MDETAKAVIKQGLITGIFIGIGLSILKKLHINIGL
jgi:hypothetical protein